MEHVGQREKKGGKWTIVVAFCRESGLRWDTGSPAMVSISSSTRVSFFSMDRGGRWTRSSLIFARHTAGKSFTSISACKNFLPASPFPHNGTIRERRQRFNLDSFDFREAIASGPGVPNNLSVILSVIPRRFLTRKKLSLEIKTWRLAVILA